MQPKCKVCKNDIWRVKEWENKACCENCNTPRPWHPRKRRADKITPSQEQAIIRIKRFFTDEWRDKEPGALSRFGVRFETEFGNLWLSVETAGGILARRGGLFHIGRRGKAKCVQAYGVGSNDDTVKHYNYMVRKKC